MMVGHEAAWDRMRQGKKRATHHLDLDRMDLHTRIHRDASAPGRRDLAVAELACAARRCLSSGQAEASASAADTWVADRSHAAAADTVPAEAAGMAHVHRAEGGVGRMHRRAARLVASSDRGTPNAPGRKLASAPTPG